MKLLRLLPCLLAISLFGADPKKPDYDAQYVLGPDSQEKAGVPKGVDPAFDPARPGTHFREASWDEALVLGAGGLKALRDEQWSQAFKGKAGWPTAGV